MRGEVAVAAIGARRHGIVTAVLALAAGVTLLELAELRLRGVLVSVGRGVDRLRDHPFTFEARCRAALDLAGPGAVLGVRTAARLHGFWRLRNGDDVEVLVVRGRDHRLGFGRIRQTTWLPASHVTEVGGFPVTTVARTFFDLCGDPGPHLRTVSHPYHERLMRRIYDDCLSRRGLTWHLEIAVLVVLAKQGRGGTTLCRTILMTTGKDYVPTWSELESIFVELLDAVPAPLRQQTIVGPDGFIGVVDFLWPTAKVIVEIDGKDHEGDVPEAYDAERDERLRAAGYTVFRYKYADLIGRSAAIARELGAAIKEVPT